MFIFMVACTIPMVLMVVGEVLDKFHREKLGAIFGFTGFGLCCLVVVSVVVFILI